MLLSEDGLIIMVVIRTAIQIIYVKSSPRAGHKFEKNADRNGYLANSRKTKKKHLFHEFFNDAHATFSTNGSYAAKSEQLKVEGDNTYAATGNYLPRQRTSLLPM